MILLKQINLPILKISLVPVPEIQDNIKGHWSGMKQNLVF